MEAVILSKEQFDELTNRIDQIKLEVGKSKDIEDIILDNQKFIQLLGISKRTAQNWRDNGIVAFSQIGSKVYYRMTDVQKLIDANLKPAFKKK